MGRTPSEERLSLQARAPKLNPRIHVEAHIWNPRVLLVRWEVKIGGSPEAPSQPAWWQTTVSNRVEGEGTTPPPQTVVILVTESQYINSNSIVERSDCAFYNRNFKGVGQHFTFYQSSLRITGDSRLPHLRLYPMPVRRVMWMLGNTTGLSTTNRMPV